MSKKQITQINLRDVFNPESQKTKDEIKSILDEFATNTINNLKPSIKGKITTKKLIDRKIARYDIDVSSSDSIHWVEESEKPISLFMRIKRTSSGIKTVFTKEMPVIY